MIGSFILGGLAVAALMKFLHGRRGVCWHHRHGGWGHGGWGHHGPGRGYAPDHDEDDEFFMHGHGPRSWRRRVPLFTRFMAHRLDATPGQERAIDEALRQFRSDLEPLAGEADKTRADLAAALRKPNFDEVLFGELFARHDEALEKARKAAVGLGARLHEALDERQRDRLASFIERGRGFSFRARPW
jgi:hypothetical protein